MIDASILRFGAVAVLGLGIDMAIAWAVAALLGLPIAVAVASGFLAGAAFNYLLHELWTFPGGKPSALGGSMYLAIILATLAVRAGVASALRRFVFTAPGQVLAPLVIAVGCSFLVNFALSRAFVFRRQAR